MSYKCSSVLLLFSSLLLELAALSSQGICIDGNLTLTELSQTEYEILLDITQVLHLPVIVYMSIFNLHLLRA
jgi:hypothetical protein